MKTKVKASVYVSVGVNTDVSGDTFGDENGMAELNIEGALTDELKIIQVSLIGWRALAEYCAVVRRTNGSHLCAWLKLCF